MLNRVGVHQAHLLAEAEARRGKGRAIDPQVEAAGLDVLKVQMRVFFAAMGVSKDIVDLSFQTKPTEIHWMTRGELLDLKLVTNLSGGDAQIAALRPTSTPPKTVMAFVRPPQSPASPATSTGPGLGAPGMRLPIRPGALPSSALPSSALPSGAPAPSAFVPNAPVSHVPASNIPTSNVPAPVAPAPDPVREFASVMNLDLNAVYSVDVIFGHAQGSGDVLWTVDVRRLGIPQTVKAYELQLALPRRVAFAAVAAAGTSAPSRLEGHMALADYCAIARAAVQVRLTVPSEIGPRPTSGVTQRILSDKDVWPDCAAQVQVAQ